MSKSIELLNDVRETLIAIGHRAGAPLPQRELDRVTRSPAVALHSLTAGLAEALVYNEIIPPGTEYKPSHIHTPENMLAITALVRRLVTHAETELMRAYPKAGDA